MTSRVMPKRSTGPWKPISDRQVRLRHLVVARSPVTRRQSKTCGPPKAGVLGRTETPYSSNGLSEFSERCVEDARGCCWLRQKVAKRGVGRGNVEFMRWRAKSATVAIALVGVATPCEHAFANSLEVRARSTPTSTIHRSMRSARWCARPTRACRRRWPATGRRPR